MSKSVAIIGARNKEGSGQRYLRSKLTSNIRVVDVNLEHQVFKFGSLDLMLQGLEKITKFEQLTENFLKKIEKISLEVSPQTNLYTHYVESKDKGQISVTKYLLNFSWDDFRYPRAPHLNDQIKNFEERLESMEKNFKIKYQNFQESKQMINQNSGLKENIGVFLNCNLNDAIYELTKKGKLTSPETLFVRSHYVKSIVVYIPKAILEKFLASYEFESKFVIPDSYTLLDEQYDLVMAHVSVFSRGVEDVRSSFKSTFGVTMREFELNLEEARQKETDRKSIHEQHRTLKEQLEITTLECYKETIVMICHIKILKTLIDCQLRFGTSQNYIVSLLVFDLSRETKMIADLIKSYAEEGRLEFYGTKEQLNDSENFFPFVYSTYTFTITG